ncbi:MAG TPA: hypothetical protein VEH52_04680 [Gaiellaceae bacterium]|nr:hypothetical protein [Gaiellaceae bacterium]
MYAIAIHTISDPDKFWAAAQEIQVPADLTLHTVVASQDGKKGVCTWEGQSLDSIREFLDPVTEGMATNEYFEANEKYSMGLPAHAGAAS